MYFFRAARRTTLVLLIMLTFNGLASAAQKLALCIGIDQYAGVNRLNGCVNDATEWENYFRSVGFDVSPLHDRAANRAGIISAIRAILQKAHSGDTVVIQFAGHGTLVPDYNQEESDNKDEAIVPVDLDVIVDDELGRLIDGSASGVGVYVFFDCCHSGTGTRVLIPPTPRGIGRETKTRFITATPDMLEKARRRYQQRTASRSVFEVNPKMREILFAACQPEETSLETGGHGVFTTAAMRVLKSGFSGSNHDFVQRVVAVMGSSRPQTPELSCASGNERLSWLANNGAASPIVLPNPGPITKPTPKPKPVKKSFEEILAALKKIGGEVEPPPKRGLVPPTNIDDLIRFLEDIAAGK